MSLDAEDGKRLSDAAIILQSYLLWGKDCLKHFLGDFALLIWDPREQWLFGARDVLGAKDLVYHVGGGVVLIASSVPMLLTHSGIQPILNESMIFKYLALNYGDEENTFYQGIFHVPPMAHYILVKKDVYQLERYWQIDPNFHKSSIRNRESMQNIIVH